MDLENPPVITSLIAPMNTQETGSGTSGTFLIVCIILVALFLLALCFYCLYTSIRILNRAEPPEDHEEMELLPIQHDVMATYYNDDPHPEVFL